MAAQGPPESSITRSPWKRLFGHPIACPLGHSHQRRWLSQGPGEFQPAARGSVVCICVPVCVSELVLEAGPKQLTCPGASPNRNRIFRDQ